MTLHRASRPTRLSTGELNRVIEQILSGKHTAIRRSACAQKSTTPPSSTHTRRRSVCSSTEPDLFDPAYQRFLINRFRELLPFAGSPDQAADPREKRTVPSARSSMWPQALANNDTQPLPHPATDRLRHLAHQKHAAANSTQPDYVLRFDAQRWYRVRTVISQPVFHVPTPAIDGSVRRFTTRRFFRFSTNRCPPPGIHATPKSSNERRCWKKQRCNQTI